MKKCGFQNLQCKKFLMSLRTRQVGYMNALKDHLNNLQEEKERVDKETTDDYTSLEIYVDEIRGDFEDVVCQLNEISRKPRIQRKEVEKLEKYADKVLRNY
nr:MAG TPA: hypothetical protein [Caudoviricetes sp.]